MYNINSKTRSKKASTVSLVLVLFLSCASGFAGPLPNPQLAYVGQQPYMANGQQWVRYNLRVNNYSAYPPYLFAPSPQLPPCGNNPNASRTWVDIYNRMNGRRIYGFCSLRSPRDLLRLWFAVKAGVTPPPWVYIVMKDRLTQTNYKSNTVAIP